MVDVFTGALMIEVLVPGGIVVVLVEVKTSKGAEVGGFDGVLLFGVSVTGLMLDAGTNDAEKGGIFVLGVTMIVLLEVKSAGGAEVGGFDVALVDGISVTVVVLVKVTTSGEPEVGGFDVALIFGVSETGLMLDAGTNDAEKDGVAGFATPLVGLLDAAKDGAEGELDTATLVTKVLDRAGGGADAGVLFVEILAIGVKPGVVEVAGLDGAADDGEAGLPAVETTIDVVVVGAAKAGVANTSPQARAAMELLRWLCMVVCGQLH